MSAPRLRRPVLAAALLGTATFLAVLGVPAQPAWSQQPAKETPPAPQTPREVRIPEVHQKTLANGLRVVVVENHEQPSVSLRVVVPAGRIYDRADRAGLASATATLLTKGTASRSASQIADTIDLVGGTLQTQSSADTSFAQSQLTSDQVDLGLELLADVILRPSFPAEEIERWRKQTLNNLQVQAQTPNYLAQAVFERALFGDHPYGLPSAGTPQSVSALQRADFVRFHQTHYLPNSAIVTVAGDVKPAEAFAKVERHFGSWKQGQAPKPPASLKALPATLAASAKRRILVVDKPDSVQTQVSVGQLGVSYTDPNYFPAQVYGTILGGGVSSRLYREIRRDRGLSYGAYSTFQTPVQTGSFRAGTSTKTESTLQALDLIVENLEKMAAEPVPTDELEGRKAYLSGSFVQQLEIPESLSNLLVQAMINGQGKESVEAFRERIDAVTVADIQRFARERIHPDRALIVLVGNASAFVPELEKKYGPVETIPYQEVDLLQAGLRRAPATAEPKPAS